jgi:hypothetical protein
VGLDSVGVRVGVWRSGRAGGAEGSEQRVEGKVGWEGDGGVASGRLEGYFGVGRELCFGQFCFSRWKSEDGWAR